MGTQPDEMTTGGGPFDQARGAAGGTNDGEEQVVVVEAEIVETREDLADTVREIGDRLEPANLAREAREQVAGAAMGKVEQMSIGAQETWRDVRTGNAGGILDLVRENPVPAGMVGIGLAVLLMNRGQKSGAGSGGFGQWQGGDRPGADRYGRGRYASGYGASGYGAYGSNGGDWTGANGGGRMAQMGDMASSARDAMSDAAGSIGDQMGQMADSVGEMAGDLPEQAGAMWDQGMSQAQRFMEENPLGAGLLALAAGAAIGMLIPSTSFERENVGPMRDQMVDKAASAAEDAIDTVSSSSGAAGSTAPTPRTGAAR